MTRTGNARPGGGRYSKVWIPEDIGERWKASGLSLGELVRLGLAAAEERGVNPEAEELVQDRLRELRSAVAAAERASARS